MSWHWSLAGQETEFFADALSGRARVGASTCVLVVASRAIGDGHGLAGARAARAGVARVAQRGAIDRRASRAFTCVRIAGAAGHARIGVAIGILRAATLAQIVSATGRSTTQLSTLQPSVSAQLSAPPPHTPAVHLSLVVQTLPSLHSVPSVLRRIRAGAGARITRPGFVALVAGRAGPRCRRSCRRRPDTCRSACTCSRRHTWLPSALAGFEHVPVLPSHVPSVWHLSSTVHVTGLAPVQTPVWQVSVWVHSVPSLQVAPSALAGLVQLPLRRSCQRYGIDRWQCRRARPRTRRPGTYRSWCTGRRRPQVEPLTLVGLSQTPLDLSQVPAV